MNLKTLRERADLDQKSKSVQYISQMNNFINLLEDKDLSEKTITFINSKVEQINNIRAESDLRKRLRKTQGELLQFLTKEYKLVTQNYYRNTWMMVGMGAIGVPIGTTLGLLSDNMGLIGIGLPIGMAIGIGIGVYFDKKAHQNGNQLGIEIKY